jgi:hypothetical protein
MTEPSLAAAAIAGILAGLWLLARGFGGYRTATRIADTGTSAIATMAAGEVRVAGTIEAMELTLVSPLQSEPCVYYRAVIRGSDGTSELSAEFDEERGVGFAVRDGSGSVRVFPRNARWDAPVRFEASTGAFGDEPPGLRLRMGAAVDLAEPDRATAIARLLTVRRVSDDGAHPLLRGRHEGGRRYEEARLAAGDPITVVGRAMPAGDLDDPLEADVALGSGLPHDDPEVAMNIAEARAAGLLKADPAEAWGNAAIPGFGIGRPVRPPELDPAAERPVLAAAEEAERSRRTFHIAPETLVLAGAPGVPLLIAHGVPGTAVERHQDRFALGLLGAVLAIASAVGLALVVSGGVAS